MTRSIDGVVGRTTAPSRVSPEWSPRTRSFETLGSKVGPRRVNVLEGAVVRQPTNKPKLPQQPIQRQFARPITPKTSRKGLPQWLQMPLIIGGAMLAGLAMQNVVLGQLGVIAYGAAALMLGIPSRTSFILALLSMLATTGLLVFKGDVALSQNFAVYTFLLLVVGVITLNRELKKEGGRIYSRRTRN